MLDAMEPVRYISVIGPGRCTAEQYHEAQEVGRLVAGRGAVLVCGGLGGVMEAAARGAREGGGSTVGILPGHDRARRQPLHRPGRDHGPRRGPQSDRGQHRRRRHRGGRGLRHPVRDRPGRQDRTPGGDPPRLAARATGRGRRRTTPTSDTPRRPKRPSRSRSTCWAHRRRCAADGRDLHPRVMDERPGQDHETQELIERFEAARIRRRRIRLAAAVAGVVVVLAWSIALVLLLGSEQPRADGTESTVAGPIGRRRRHDRPPCLPRPAPDRHSSDQHHLVCDHRGRSGHDGHAESIPPRPSVRPRPPTGLRPPRRLRGRATWW